MSADVTLAAWTTRALARFEPALAEVFAEAWPPAFRDACRYPLQTGGKRIRPLLCLAAAEAVRPDAEVESAPLAAALALELLHTYSLVHDDLPCMDDDDERRGRPTVHVVYGQGAAVLVGDALLSEAFAVLASLPAGLGGALVRELAAAGGARGMIAGQAVDIGMDGPIVTRDALERLHRAKTGALLRASVRMGALAVGASAADLDALSAYGESVGLAFQVQDDILDADQDSGDAGPPSFVKLLGLDGAARLAREEAARADAAVAHLPAPQALRALAHLIVDRTV
jgi:geranylgeranyl pyrophosphate synthase